MFDARTPPPTTPTTTPATVTSHFTCTKTGMTRPPLLPSPTASFVSEEMADAPTSLFLNTMTGRQQEHLPAQRLCLFAGASVSKSESAGGAKSNTQRVLHSSSLCRCFERSLSERWRGRSLFPTSHLSLSFSRNKLGTFSCLCLLKDAISLPHSGAACRAEESTVGGSRPNPLLPPLKDKELRVGGQPDHVPETDRGIHHF